MQEQQRKKIRDMVQLMRRSCCRPSEATLKAIEDALADPAPAPQREKTDPAVDAVVRWLQSPTRPGPDEDFAQAIVDSVDAARKQAADAGKEQP